MLHPAPGMILLEIVPIPHTSKLAKVEGEEESNYGKILDWGLSLNQEGTVLNVPRFTTDTNDEGLGGKERKLKKGDIVVFEERTARRMSDDYSSGPKIVEVPFNHILALYEENK